MTAAEARKLRLIDRITRSNRDRLFGVIRYLVPTREDAEDILQDVLYRFTCSFDQIISLERAAVWLYTAARNRVSDFYRKRSRDAGGYLAEPPAVENETTCLLDEILPDLSQNPERQFMQESISCVIIDALATLPPAQRDVFIWHEIEGLNFKEIAELTGQPVSTLLSRKRYAILALRKQLQSLKSLNL